MVFSDTSTNQGLVQEARWLVGANTSSYNINDLTRNINRWFDRAVALIFQSSYRWQWDDSNQTTYPIATTDAVSGQTDYTLDVSYLRVHRVEVKNQAGQWVKLETFDPKDIGSNAIGNFETNDGVPQAYDVIANSLFLYPAFSFDQADSIKVWFQRKGSYFATDDTTKVAGFAEIFHRYLSLGAAFDYALKNNLSNRNQLREEIQLMEDEIKEFYAFRQPDEPIRLKARKISYR